MVTAVGVGNVIASKRGPAAYPPVCKFCKLASLNMLLTSPSFSLFLLDMGYSEPLNVYLNATKLGT